MQAHDLRMRILELERENQTLSSRERSAEEEAEEMRRTAEAAGELSRRSGARAATIQVRR